MLSKKNANDIALKALQDASDQRGKRVYEVDNDDSAISFQMFLSCGYCAIVGEHLAYNPEVQWPDAGIVKFKKRNIIVKLDRKTLVRIPLATVIDFVSARDGAVTLTLSNPPFFFSDKRVSTERSGPRRRGFRAARKVLSVRKTPGQALPGRRRAEYLA